MAAKMAEKMKLCQNKSTDISIDDKIQSILDKNSEKYRYWLCTGIKRW